MKLAVCVEGRIVDLINGQSVPLALEEKHHLKVKRCRNQELVRLHDGMGGLGVAVFQDGELIFNEIVPSSSSLSPDVHLCIGQLDVRHFEWLLEKATELGIRSIQPLRTEFTDSGTISEARRKTDRHRRILVESMKQSGQRWIPDLKGMLDLSTAVEALRGEDIPGHQPGHHVVALEPQSAGLAQIPIGQPFKTLAPEERCTLWIGPEGGWAPQEVQLLKTLNPMAATMPDAVFRSETAALFFASLILYPYK